MSHLLKRVDENEERRAEEEREEKRGELRNENKQRCEEEKIKWRKKKRSHLKGKGIKRGKEKK